LLRQLIYHTLNRNLRPVCTKIVVTKNPASMQVSGTYRREAGERLFPRSCS